MAFDAAAAEPLPAFEFDQTLSWWISQSHPPSKK
jgi:hypothetical protein